MLTNLADKYAFYSIIYNCFVLYILASSFNLLTAAVRYIYIYIYITTSGLN